MKPMFGIGWGELTVIFFLILLLFGPKKAQSILKAFGKGIREFKQAMSGLDQSASKPADHYKPKEGTEEDDVGRG